MGSGGGGWNPIRDVLETAGTLGGNYLLPGSSLVTDHLVSKGSQGQLNSPLGVIGQIGTGLAGTYGAGPIPSASSVGAGWGNAANAAGLTGEGSILGTSAGTPVEGGIGPTQGSGALGAATRGISSAENSLSSLLSSSGNGGSGGSSSFGNYGGLGAALLGGANSLYANDQAQKALKDAENKSLTTLSPYLASGAAANTRLSDLLGTSNNTGASGYGSLNTPFTAASLQSDPGYQFQLQQGNQALDRKQAASGNYFSGAALKQAQDYGQGLADSTLNQAFARDQAQKQQQYGMYAGQSGAGQTAANTASNLYGDMGTASANSGIATSNTLNGLLSSILSGSGAKRPINVGGQVVYV